MVSTNTTTLSRFLHNTPICLCFVVFCLLGGATAVEAQVVNNFNFQNRVAYNTQYYWQMPTFNPAYTGDDTQPNFVLSGQLGRGFSRRVNINDPNYANNPTTYNLIFHDFNENIQSGYGINAYYHNFDNTFRDVVNNNEVTAAKERILKMSILYSYQMEFGANSTLSLGINLSGFHFNSAVNGSSVEGFFKSNLDIGALLKSGNLRFGLAIANVRPITFFGSATFDQKLYLSGSYDLAVGDALQIMPQFIINAPLSQTIAGASGNQSFVDLSVVGVYNDLLLAGVSYRRNDTPFTYSLMAGVRLADSYQVSVAYNLKNGNNAGDYSKIETVLGIGFN